MVLATRLAIEVRKASAENPAVQVLVQLVRHELRQPLALSAEDREALPKTPSHQAPLVALFFLPASVVLFRKQRDTRAALLVGWVYLLVHCAVGHKEPRFLLPVLPLLSAVSAAGIAPWVESWLRKHVTTTSVRRTLIGTIAAAILFFGASRALSFTYSDLWDPHGAPSDRVLFGKRATINRSLVKAGNEPDLCGMLLLGLLPSETFSGGMTYLHRDVLLVSPPNRRTLPMSFQAANYAVAPSSVLPPGWQRVALIDDIALVSRPGDCIVVPEQYRRTYRRPRK